jgi:hypothetical protein
MIPVPGLDDIRVYWLKVRRSGTVLHGYLLYAASDHRFPEYMADEGIGDLDSWTGEECGIFVFQSPPEGWIKHAARTDHIWSKLVKEVYGNGCSEEVIEFGIDMKFAFNGKETTLKNLFADCTDSYAHRDLIRQVLQHFSLPVTSHPCLILFQDLYGKQFWHVALDDLLNKPEGDLRKALKIWFSGSDFGRLIEEARRASRH